MLLLLLIVAAVVALGVLNMQRTVPTARPTAPPPSAPTVQPSPAVTPRVTTPLTPTPAPTATPRPVSPTPSVAASPTAPPLRQARVANTSGAGVTVRAEPGPQGRSVSTLREGTVVQLTGAEQTTAARLWRELQTPDRAVRGWVLADFLDVAQQ